MEVTQRSPFYSSTLGINKTGIVQHYLTVGCTVAFARDGFPDAEPARLVPDELRFARGDLAHVLQQEGLTFRRYGAWSDIAKTLLNEPD